MYTEHKLWSKIWNRTDYILEWSSLLTILIFVTYAIYAYVVLPDEIPIHFNYKGEADRYDEKGNIFLILAVGVLLYVGLTYIQHFSKNHNYPITKTPENEDQLEFLSLRLLRWIKLLCCILMLVIVRSFFVGSKMGILEFTVLVITVVLIILMPLYFIVKMSKVGRR